MDSITHYYTLLVSHNWSYLIQEREKVGGRERENSIIIYNIWRENYYILYRIIFNYYRSVECVLFGRNVRHANIVVLHRLQYVNRKYVES